MNNFKEMLLNGEIANMIKEETKGHAILNSQELYNIMKPLVSLHKDVEAFYMLFLDSKNRIISIEKMFSGSIIGASVYPRELIKKALEVGATAVIGVHNHPSGDVTPSNEDLNITKKILFSMHAIDVSFHEHMIIGSDTYSSLAGNIADYKKELTKNGIL